VTKPLLGGWTVVGFFIKPSKREWREYK